MSAISNGRIRSTMLGFEDHGILSSMIDIEADGWGQGFGGWSLTGKEMAIFVEGVLKALEVKKWEYLVGKNVRIDHSHTGVEGIGHIYKDNWFYPRKAFEELA